MVDKLTGCRKSDAVAMVLADIEAHHRGVIASNLWQPLRQAIERNPAPFIASMGLALADRSQAKRKTMAQIFTSPGKGAKRETLHLPKRNPIGIDVKVTSRKSAPANPIGIDNEVENHQSLSCVGIAFPKRGFATPSIADSARSKDTERTVERDSDAPAQDLSDWDGQTFDRAAVVIDDDGVIRERDYHQPQPDGYDQPGAEW